MVKFLVSMFGLCFVFRGGIRFCSILVFGLFVPRRFFGWGQRRLGW